MVSKRLIKHIGEFVCLGCLKKETCPFAHIGIFGCSEPFKIKLDYVCQFGLNDIYKESVVALGLKYNKEKLEGWKEKVFETTNKDTIRSAYGLENDTTKVEENGHLVESVTPEIVTVVAQEMKLFHMWLYGIFTFDLCPRMTIIDFNLHFADAMHDCYFWCADVVIQDKLYDAVANLLNVKIKHL